MEMVSSLVERATRVFSLGRGNVCEEEAGMVNGTCSASGEVERVTCASCNCREMETCVEVETYSTALEILRSGEVEGKVSAALTRKPPRQSLEVVWSCQRQGGQGLVLKVVGSRGDWRVLIRFSVV